jgi:GDP-L-fucose synthase
MTMEKSPQTSSLEFWQDKRVIVTGGAGFLGSFVVEKLKQRGAVEIIVPTIDEFNLCDIHDIQRLFDRALGSTKNPDLHTLVIHLAALAGGIGANRARPADFFYVNLIMGVQLMHEAWKRGVDKFVAIGTICAYPKYTPLPFKEENLWDGYPEETNAPYGLAKKMLLVQAQAYRDQYGFNAIFPLPVNLYGPQARDEKQIVLWGDGSPTREFLYVEDAAEGILLASERYDGNEPFNLGSGMEISIKNLAEMVARLSGFTGEIVWDTSKPNGQPRRALDISRAETFFGFRAKMPFEEGLRRTIQWYRSQSSQR